MPSTFYDAKDCWKLKEGEMPTPMSYLFDANRNARYWSCWVRKKLNPHSRKDISLVVVKHHAGMGNLSEWMAAWKGRAIENDLELQIEAYRFTDTQRLVRNVLADAAVVEASGFFETGADSSRRVIP